LSPHISVNRRPHHACVCQGSCTPSAALFSCSDKPSLHAFSYMCLTSFKKPTSGHSLDFYISISCTNVFVVQTVICLPYSYYCYTEHWDQQEKNERMGDRGIIRLLVPQTLTLFLPHTHTHTHTHTHARMTDLCVEAFACLYERQKPCKMGFSPCKTCSFRKWENEAERERERERERKN